MTCDALGMNFEPIRWQREIGKEIGERDRERDRMKKQQMNDRTLNEQANYKKTVNRHHPKNCSRLRNMSKIIRKKSNRAFRYYFK